MKKDVLYARALGTVSSRRQKAVTDARVREAQALARIPQLQALQNEKIQAGVSAARLSALGADQKAVDEALAALDLLDAQRAALLAENGLCEADLAPHYTCPVCKDSGSVGGVVCECVHNLVREMRQQQVNETSPLSLCSFASFDVNKYPTTLVPELGISAREQMSQIVGYCKAYAEHFTPKSTSLYLCGYAGLGKTHLALSIANAVLAKGYDVVYVSAQDAFDRVEKERFGESGDTMQTLLSAELLIVDDLGTEYISPYVSACLYSLLNTRSNKRLPTIYTSNIVNDADLRRRYTEKIASRLLGSCEVLSFCGEDIRLQGK